MCLRTQIYGEFVVVVVGVVIVFIVAFVVNVVIVWTFIFKNLTFKNSVSSKKLLIGDLS